MFDSVRSRPFGVLLLTVALVAIVASPGCDVFPIFNPPDNTTPPPDTTTPPPDTTTPPPPTGTPAPVNTAPGTPAFGDASGLPGLVVTIQKMTQADTDFVPQFGKNIAVTFTLKTRAGQPIAATDLTRFSTYISGLPAQYQRVLPAE